MAICMSHIQGDAVCTDGFIQVPACGGVVCPTCGAPPKTRPWCEREDIPPHWLDDNGATRFYKEPT